jgi:hypothetical protein
MDVFEFRDRLVSEYERFTRSFIRIRATDIKTHVDGAPMVQLNPSFVPGGEIGQLVAEGLLHPECERSPARLPPISPTIIQAMN